MKTQRFALGVAALLLAAITASAQEGLPVPSPIEKDLAARASDVTEVTLGKDMLGFASKFMNGKSPDDATAQQLIQGLNGIYVRSYEFDKEGEYSPEQVEALRRHFETGEWTPVVRARERKSNQTTDVMMKMVNGQAQGLFVLAAEPRELSIVLILGPIRMEDLGKLSGMAGLAGPLGPLSGVQHTPRGKKVGPQ